MTTTRDDDGKREVGEKASGGGTNQEGKGDRWNMPLGKPGCQPHQPGGRGTTTTGTEHRTSTRQHLGQRGNNAGA
ncbi:hypothetical protein GQ42DRAFT_161871 [Ramicandelaber brevisporus]|nr:hypothetical protein GQ42DRAFT_161871 [Ramicandelaber brevisporus]